MSYNENLLFYFLRIGLGTESKFDFEFSENPNWKFIFDMSSEHGVLAIVLDGIENLVNQNLIPQEFLPSHTLKMQWAMNVMKIEDTFEHQYASAKDLSNLYAREGVQMVVMKGIVSAVQYPKPNHRPCGDVDCFLMGNYDKGNKIAERLGINIDFRHYKHAIFTYKNLMVENHEFLTNVRGPKRNKTFERLLQNLLKDRKPTAINDTNLISASPLFNALFLTVHSWRHFLNEKIGLRHISDWAMLMKHNCNDIDWKRFVEIINIRDTKMIDFARCISFIAHYYMGAPMPPIFKDCKQPDELSERVLRYILYDHKTDSCNIPHYWRRKFIILFDRLKGNWKYEAFSDESNLKVTYNLFYDRWCEKHPHL